MIRATIRYAAEPMSEDQLGRLLKLMYEIGTRVLQREEADERQRDKAPDDHGWSSAANHGGSGESEPGDAGS